MVIKSCPLLVKDTETCVGSSLASYFLLFSLISFCFRWFRFISFSFRWFRFVSFRFCWFRRFVSFRFVFVDFVSFRFYFVSHFIGTHINTQCFKVQNTYYICKSLLYFIPKIKSLGKIYTIINDILLLLLYVFEMHIYIMYEMCKVHMS